VSRWEERYADGEARLPDEPDERQRQLTRLGNVAWGAGLSALLAGRPDEAVEWLDRAAERYRESYALAPPGSWGRPIAVLKARLLAGRDARAEAGWTLSEGAVESDSPIGRYAGTLALLVLDRDADARPVAGTLRARDDFPPPVADALAALAAGDLLAYAEAVEDVLLSFEVRDDFLEDVRVADTVLVLQILAARRDLAADLGESPLLPATS
jgi:hypothetical protein